jgi:Tol biopolymer transport system component
MEQQGAAQFAITSDRTLFYVRGGDVSDVRFVWVDRSGVEKEFGLPSKRYGQFRLSPDGATLALSVQDQTRSDIWTYDIQRKTLSRLTDNGHNLAPVWSPDGKKLIHVSLKSGVASLVETTPSGTHPRVIATIPGMMTPTWTADGKGVLVSTWESNTSTLYFVDVASGSKQELDRSPNMRVFPALSPDGRWLAYVAEETGRWEIYIRAMAQDDQRWRITTSGGEEPIWDRSGHHLFYRNGDEWMEITISPGPEFHASPPVRVIRGPYVNIPGYSYDVSGDGRFLLLKSEYQDKKTSQIEVIENWPSLLEKKK